jgi:hypothetical protein
MTCQGSDDLVYYDRGLDVLEGCSRGVVELPPTGSPFEPGIEVLVDHNGGKELCLTEKALKGHLEHGDEVLDWSGCPEEQ